MRVRSTRLDSRYDAELRSALDGSIGTLSRRLLGADTRGVRLLRVLRDSTGKWSNDLAGIGVGGPGVLQHANAE